MPDQLKIQRLREAVWTQVNCNPAHFILSQARLMGGYQTNPSVRRKYSISGGISFNGFAGTPP
jgi:hypothetical protein